MNKPISKIEQDRMKKAKVEEIIRAFIRDEDAVRLLLDLWTVMQAWDDAYDGDPNPDTAAAFELANITIPGNKYYLSAAIQFQVKQAYFDWCAANYFEKNGIEHHKAYMLRAGYYRIILTMIAFLDGDQVAKEQAAHVWGCYGETFENYRSEH